MCLVYVVKVNNIYKKQCKKQFIILQSLSHCYHGNLTAQHKYNFLLVPVVYMIASKSSSMTQQGYVTSKFDSTSGCTTPTEPMITSFPLLTMAVRQCKSWRAQRNVSKVARYREL